MYFTGKLMTDEGLCLTFERITDRERVTYNLKTRDITIYGCKVKKSEAMYTLFLHQFIVSILST